MYCLTDLCEIARSARRRFEARDLKRKPAATTTQYWTEDSSELQCAFESWFADVAAIASGEGWSASHYFRRCSPIHLPSEADSFYAGALSYWPRARLAAGGVFPRAETPRRGALLDAGAELRMDLFAGADDVEGYVLCRVRVTGVRAVQRLGVALRDPSVAAVLRCALDPAVAAWKLATPLGGACDDVSTGADVIVELKEFLSAFARRSFDAQQDICDVELQALLPRSTSNRAIGGVLARLSNAASLAEYPSIVIGWESPRDRATRAAPDAAFILARQPSRVVLS